MTSHRLPRPARPAPGPKLSTCRFSTAAAALDGCIYATGGYNGSYLQVGGPPAGGLPALCVLAA